MIDFKNYLEHETFEEIWADAANFCASKSVQLESVLVGSISRTRIQLVEDESKSFAPLLLNFVSLSVQIHSHLSIQVD